MLELALFNFIIYNFHQTLLTSGLIFHCWELPAAKIFAQMASVEGFYMQFVNIGNQSQMNFMPRMKEEFFKRDRPIYGVFLDMNCANSPAILNASSFFHLFNEHYHWVLYERFNNMEAFEEFADMANFFVSSDVTYVLAEQPAHKLIGNVSNENYFILYDVYNNGPWIGGKLNITIDRRVCCTDLDCKIDRYLSSMNLRSKYGNRNSQRDLIFRIATVVPGSSSLPISEKLNFLYSRNNTYNDPLMRFGFQQSILLMEMLYANFSLTFFDRSPADEVFVGASLNTLIEGQSDLSSTPIAMTSARLKYFQILIETGTFHSICLFRRPRNIGIMSSTKTFLDPFNRPVWIAFCVLLLVSSIQLWIMFYFEFHRMPTTIDHPPSLLTSCLLSVGTACVQGSYIVPGSVSGRTTYTVIGLSTFLLFNYYTSIIVATLLDTPPKSKIKTVAQLADSSLDLGFEPIPSIFDYLNNSQLPDVRRLVKKKIESRKNPLTAWVPLNEAILRIRDEVGTFGYVFEASSGFGVAEKYYKPEEICDLNEVRLRPESTLANQLPINSSFKELMRLRLMRTLETGINRGMTNYWIRKSLNCFDFYDIDEVDLAYSAPLFLLMLIFFVISVFVLWIELIYNRFGNRQLIESLCLS